MSTKSAFLKCCNFATTYSIFVKEILFCSEINVLLNQLTYMLPAKSETWVNNLVELTWNDLRVRPYLPSFVVPVVRIAIE